MARVRLGPGGNAAGAIGRAGPVGYLGAPPLREPRLTRSALAPLAALAFVFAASAALAAEPDWEKLADVGQIEVITHDEDGDVRETTIWFVVVDGQGFIRGGNSNWIANIRRNPADVVLRIEEREYPLRAEFIENDELRERIVAAFRAKYGWFDGAVDFVRGKRPNIMHMVSR